MRPEPRGGRPPPGAAWTGGREGDSMMPYRPPGRPADGDRQRMPRSLRLTYRPASPSTTWSRISIPRSWPAATSRRVRATSSALGSGSPLGCGWHRTRAAAEARIAGFITMAGWTRLEARQPTETVCRPISRWRIVKSATTKTSRSVSPMYSARTRAASAGVFRLGRSLSITPGSRTSATRKPGNEYGRVGFGRDMVCSEGSGGGRTAPASHRSRGGVGSLAVLVHDPRLDALHHVERPVHGAQVVEVTPLAPRAEGTRREGHVDLALGALPQAEADELGASQRTLVEVDLGLAHQTLGAVLSRHELHAHRISSSGLLVPCRPGVAFDDFPRPPPGS